MARLGRDKSGTVVVLAAVIFPVVVGGMGLGAEAGYWYYTQRKLQHAADTAVHAAAVRKGQGDSKSQYEKVGLHVAERSGFKAAGGSFELNEPPTDPSAYAPGGSSYSPNQNALQVVLTENMPRLFAAVFTGEPLTLTARAVALVQYGSDGCVLALSKTGTAVSMSGSTEVTLADCDVASNSTSATAFNMQGSAQLTTGCVHTVGGASPTQNLTLTDEVNGEGVCADGPHEYAPTAYDPYADVEQPVVGGGCTNFNHNNAVPGHYCSMNINQTTHLAPGVYIVNGGEFRAGPNATVTGEGVTIFLTNGAKVRVQNNAVIDLSAPTEGPYAGILFFSDRDDFGVDHRFNGGVSTSFNGAIYLPSGNVQFSGGSGVQGGCIQIIGYTVEFTGNSQIGSDCEAAGTRSMRFGQVSRIVE